MSVKLLTEHHLEFLSLQGDCAGSSESTLVKMPYCWKSHVTAHLKCENVQVIKSTKRARYLNYMDINSIRMVLAQVTLEIK